jgi:hypothetical protein
MQKLSAIVQDPRSFHLNDARREGQKTVLSETETNRGYTPPNSLRTKVKSRSDRDDWKATEKRGRSDAKPVEVGSERNGDPADAPADSIHGGAGGLTLGGELSDEQFRDMLALETPKAEPLEGPNKGRQRSPQDTNYIG